MVSDPSYCVTIHCAMAQRTTVENTPGEGLLWCEHLEGVHECEHPEDVFGCEHMYICTSSITNFGINK